MLSAYLLAGFGQTLAGILMFLTALFLILLVLVQRGRGGGLAGAFGGMGGQSAFGTKAGDTFTKITIAAAAFWILLCMAAVKFLGSEQSAFAVGGDVPAATGTADVDSDLADDSAEMTDDSQMDGGGIGEAADATQAATGEAAESAESATDASDTEDAAE